MASVGKAIAVGIGGAAVGGVAALGAAMVQGVKDAISYQTLAQKTAGVIKSTGDVAHISVAGVQSLAANLETLSGVDEETIINGENVLATFTNIRNEVGKGNDIFNQATEASLNMSTALGEDLKDANIQLGKALNDPIKGITALQRVGVSFTDAQKKQIAALVKSGDVMGAQKVILRELNTEFGGAAKAAGSGLAGAVAHMKDVFGDAFRDIGTMALPMLTQLAHWMAERIPAAIGVLKTALSVVAAAFAGHPTAGLTGGFQDLSTAVGLARGAFLGIVSTGKALLDFYEHHRTLVQSVAVGLIALVGTVKTIIAVTKVWEGVQALMNIELLANPIGIVIVAIAGLTAGIIYAYKHSETFRNIVQAVGSACVTAFKAVYNAVSSVVGWIGQHWPLLLSILTGPIGAAAIYILRHWSDIKQGALNAFNSVVTFCTQLPGRLLHAVGNLGHTLWQGGNDLLNGLLNGAVNALKNVGSWVKNVGTRIVNAVKGFFGIHSPSTLFAGLGVNMIQGLVQGLSSTNPLDIAKSVFGGLPQALSHLVSTGVVDAARLGSKALNALGGIFGGIGASQPTAGAGGAGKWMAVAIEALALTHSPQSWLGSLLARMNKESGGNQFAINMWDSNAKLGQNSRGLMQVIPSTFAAYAGSYASRGIFDPLANIIASINYANARYGSAPVGWNQPGGYDSGGWLKPGYTLAYNGTGRSERVLGPGEGTGGDVSVRVFIGETELTGIIRTEVDQGLESAAREIMARR